MRKVLVTGSAGFIGFHLAQLLLDEGFAVVGFDGMTDYYDVRIKERRHQMLLQNQHFTAHVGMLEDFEGLRALMLAEKPDVIVHLAAQAGVRYSLENPRAYVNSNLVGTFNVLELVRRHKPKHFLIASTSSVYGANETMPFGETDRADHPMTLYAATKKSGELMAHGYAHLYDVPTTALRFFTVYGPWGRPDMALFKFVDAILDGRPIDIYGEGEMSRDFTYVGDLIEAMVRLVDVVPSAGSPVGGLDSLSPAAPCRAVNIGRGEPVKLLDFIEAIERKLGRKARRNLMPMQPGDVRDTFASADLLEKLTGYRPATPLDAGVGAFVDWYREYYRK
jgi:UDP-glucuronate 4-epimerase